MPASSDSFAEGILPDSESEAGPQAPKGGEKILILGDIVGRPGRDIVKELVPEVRRRWGLDLVIANAENCAAGSGITMRLFRELRRAEIDLMTMGDHAWKRRDNIEVLKKEDRLLRPHNYPDEAVGTGVGVVNCPDGSPVAVITVLGRTFMPAVDCPFKVVDKALEELDPSVKIRIVEVHAEATSEKIAMGWHLKGRASCVFGTHTHVPTADDRILPGGTAYITDLGMTGPYDGVIGRDHKPVLHKFITSMHATFSVAENNAHMCGVYLRVDPLTGQCLEFRRVDLSEACFLDLETSTADEPELGNAKSNNQSEERQERIFSEHSRSQTLKSLQFPEQD